MITEYQWDVYEYLDYSMIELEGAYHPHHFCDEDGYFFIYLN